MPVLISTQPPHASDSAPLTKSSRPGTTMMEYLMMISLIIVICLAAVGYLGTSNDANLTGSSNSISKAIKKAG